MENVDVRPVEIVLYDLHPVGVEVHLHDMLDRISHDVEFAQRGAGSGPR